MRVIMNEFQLTIPADVTDGGDVYLVYFWVEGNIFIMRKKYNVRRL